MNRYWPLLALLCLTLLLTWPTAITLTTHIPDRQDPLLNAWILAWEAHQLLREPLDLYQANIFFPQAHTLAYSEILLSTSLLVMPLQWLTGHALLSYNLAFLLAFFLTALGGYLLALYLTGQRGAALVAGVALAWSPYRMGHLSQLQLLTFGWLPLALLYLDRLLRADTPQPRAWVKGSLLFALFFLLQALASFYAALFSAIACALYVLGWLLWQRRLPRSAIAGGLLAGALIAGVMMPVSWPYFQVQRTLGAGWTLEQNEQFSASLQAYAYAPEGTYFWGPLTRPLQYTYGPCCPPDTLFPGLTLLALSIVGLWRSGGRRGLWLALGLMAFLLSLGPTLTLWAGEPTGITLPYRWLWEWVPGFNAIRAPVRWAVLGTLALSLLAALGVARLRWRFAPALALLLLLLEFAVLPLPLVPAPAPPDALPWLAAQPPTRILELPLSAARPVPDTPDDEPRRAWEQSRLLEPQFFSTVHWHTTPDGYSGYIPARHGDFTREMAALPESRALALLQGLGVRYLLLHEDDLDEETLARWRAPLPDPLREVARFGDERILELVPADHPGLPTESLPVTTLPPDQDLRLPLVLTSPEGPYVPVAAEPLLVEAHWRAADGHEERRQSVRVSWPLIVEEVAVLPLPLRTPPSGAWTLTLSGSYPDGRSFVLTQPLSIALEALAPPPLLPVTLAETTWLDQKTVRLAWHSLAPLTRYYSLSVRLLAPDGTLVAQRDGPPGGEIATLGWQAGGTHTADWAFDLPPEADAREYRLLLFWYDSEDGSRAHLWDGAQFVAEMAGGE